LAPNLKIYENNCFSSTYKTQVSDFTGVC
jgi:hypothetical protein